MTTSKANVKYKDALFRIVFGDFPENALSLYNAINGTKYTNVEDLRITTLKDAVYIGIKNDVSFLFNYDMNLYEHQSTYCPNMPLRGLGYFADLYQIYLGGPELSKARIYDKRIVEIPAPKYYVFYNGPEDQLEMTELRLSSAYSGEGDIEVIAHMININKGHNDEFMQNCKPMADYSEFIDRVRKNKDEGISNEEAVELAIDSCLTDNILTDVLGKERDKVANALYTALTEEEIEWLRNFQRERDRREAREEGLAEGREEGLAEGREEGLAEGREEGLAEGREEQVFKDVSKLVSDNICNLEKACEVLGVSIDDYREWETEHLR